MQPKRFSVKYFVQGELPFELSALIPVFHRWIQEHTVEGLLIDVADYKHVYQGPGIMLIGHEGDYSLDMRGGRAGLLYTRKQAPQPTLTDDLKLAFRLAGNAARKLETENTLNGVRFDYDAAEIAFLDRLATPNTPEIFEQVRASIEEAAAALYPSNPVQITSIEQDRRKSLTVRIGVAGQNHP